MTRYIDADALKNSIDEHVYLVHHGFNESEYGITQYGIHQIIDDAPTIDAVPVRRGKWIETDEWDEFSGRLYKCSNCNTFVISDFDNYCPYCGARMDERKEE